MTQIPPKIDENDFSREGEKTMSVQVPGKNNFFYKTW